MGIVSQGPGDNAARTQTQSAQTAIVKAIADIKKNQGGDLERVERRGITTGSTETKAQITSTQNDYDSGVDDSIRISGDAARIITGFAGGSRGRYVLVVNIGAFNVQINHEDAGSLAANRVTVPGGTNITLVPNASQRIWYDKDSLRWRPVST